MKLTTTTIGSQSVDIEVNGNTGKFSAQWNDQDFTADTQAALLAAQKKGGE